MSEAGYIADQPWQYTYRRALSPQYICLALAMAGIKPRPLRRVCELAYGQGLALTIHAACNPDINFIGTDFNPGHFANAVQLVDAAGLRNIVLYGEDFDRFCAREDLSNFDLVAMVGTWSWLSQRDQGSVVEMLGRALVPNGLFCLDHCTLPGMNGFAGLVRILDVLALEPSGGETPLVERIHGTLRRTLEFMDTNPHFCSMHWRLRGAAEALFEKRPSDVAHEYFNYNARPAYFKDTAATLAPAGLAWAAHWSPTKIIDGLDLTPRQATFLNGIVEPHRREQLRDFALNTARRLDIWSKFAADEQRYARDELMGKLGFILVRPSDDFDFKIAGVLGEVALSRRLYAPLLEFLATLRPTTVEALRERLADISLDELYEALCILVDKEMIQVCAANGATAARAVGPARALNAAIIARAPESDEIAYLGSPVTGSGLRVSRLHQIFLLAEQDGARDTSDLAHFAASRLKPCGSRPIPPECSSADLLEREAEMFVRRWRPFFVALGLVDQRVSGNSRS